jgi:hypothetical protein
MALTGDAAKVAKLAQALGATKTKAESAVSSTLAKSSGSGSSTSSKPGAGVAANPTSDVQWLASQGFLKDNSQTGVNNAVAIANNAWNPTSQTYDASKLGQTTPIALPPLPESPYTPVTPITPTPTPELTSTQDEATKTFTDYMASLTQAESDKPSFEAEYAKAEKAAQIQQKQQLVNDYTLQQNNIIAQQMSDIQQVRNQSSTEGGTAGILSAREDAINRSAAIKLYPIQAQLAAAQGNLEMAQERMNTMFDLKMKDAQSQYEYKNKILEATYSFMTAQQKERADIKKQENDNTFTLKRDTINYLRESVITAYKEGNTGLAAALSRIDENSTTADADIASAFKNYGGTSGGVKAPTIQKINGVDMQWEPTTGTWVKPSVSATTGQDLTADQLGISSVDDLINNNLGGSTAVGTSYLTRSTGFWGNIGRVLTGVAVGAGGGAVAGSVLPGPGTIGGAVIGAGLGLFNALLGGGKQAVSQLSGAEQDFIGSVEQLRSGLTLQSLIDAKEKGATFGALSEGEMNVLSQSATKIGEWIRTDSNDNVIGYNIDEKSFKDELQKINNMAKLDYLKKGGNAEDIGVNITPDNRMWVQDWRGNLIEIKTY